MTQIIDIHAHYLPDFYVEAMRAAGIQDMDGWPAPEWSAARAIEVMDQHDIAAQILSLSSPGIGFAAGCEAARLARSLNTYVAEVIRTHWPRFGAFAVLPLPDVGASLDEINYAFDRLQLDGVGLLTNYNGVYLGDPVFDPIFDELDRRGAVVFVHPTTTPDGETLDGIGLPAAIMEHPFDTTRAATNLVRNRVLSRYRNVRIIVTHGGGAVPYVIPRLITGVGAECATQFRSLYYDLTATTAPGQTDLIRDVGDPRRFLIGFDFPFMAGSTIRPVMAGLVLGGFSRFQLDAIRAGNACALFPKVAARLRQRRAS